MTREDIYKKIELSSHTVFVDNLPHSMSTAWLWQLCNHEGRVVDMFMPRKKRVSNPLPFAFVRFSSKADTLKAIRNLHGTKIRGCTLDIREAKYRRFEGGQKAINPNNAGKNGGSQKGDKQGNRIDGRTFKEVVMQAQKVETEKENNPSCNDNGRPRMMKEGVRLEKTMVVYGEVDEFMMNKLSKSIIGESIFPVNIEVMEERLRRDWYTIVDVKPMGAYKTLITFETKEDVEDALGSDFLLNYFEGIRRCSEDEFCQTRRVWIECFGLPPHAWSASNLRKIGEQWGTVVCIDKKAVERMDFCSAKILIDTCYFPIIQNWVYFSVGGKGYDIFIKEMGREGVYYMNIENSQKMQNMASEDEQSNDACGGNEDGGDAHFEHPLDDTWKNDNDARNYEIGEDNLNPLMTRNETDKMLNNEEGGPGKIIDGDVSHADEQQETKYLQDDRMTEDVLQDLAHKSGKKLILGSIALSEGPKQSSDGGADHE